MRLMALDWGERRIGVALSDPEEILASPHATIDTRKTPDVLDVLDGIIRREKVGALVVGYPLRTDGRAGTQAAKVDAFIGELENRFKLNVTRMDESFSSEDAVQKIPKTRRRLDKSRIDRVAAALILQDYLNRGK